MCLPTRFNCPVGVQSIASDISATGFCVKFPEGGLVSLFELQGEKNDVFVDMFYIVYWRVSVFLDLVNVSLNHWYVELLGCMTLFS